LVVKLVEEQLLVAFAAGAVGREETQAMGKLAEGSHEALIRMVVSRFLDHVPPHDGFVAMAAILLPVDKICLPEKLRLVVLKLANHGVSWQRSCT